jgi:hypothetical protein
MIKDEILYAVSLIENLEDVSSAITCEVNGKWLPIIGVEKKNGERFLLESLDHIFSYINNNKIKGGVTN